MVDRIVAINPGATSTKIGYFENDELKFKKEITYSLEEVSKYSTILEQADFRYQDILKALEEEGIAADSLDGVVGRGGCLPPVEAGAYIVNDAMLTCLRDYPVLEHASNLGAGLAQRIAEKFGVKDCPSYIYDPITVDQMTDVARISGTALFERKSIAHMLNMRAVGIKIANEELHKPYEECNLIVAHIGGGSTVSIHEKGRITDVVADDEGLFSTERAGGLPLKEVIPLCYKHTEKEMNTLLRKNGGLVSYFGTNDARIVEGKAKDGDQKAKTVLEAMAYQIAKGIGQLATVANGNVDGIILTGGLAHSDYITDMVKDRVSFIAPVYRVPGEEELLALAQGARRVLNKKEEYHVFEEPENHR
ncbi:butyrate kinase [Jeotgalibaca sp. MA1X17-3]|uniref:butyrate kinase n=1 Tax=Jeotgalibaca sp. MA1X17-3 TaxID=2908211 RepID=UPI001F3C4FB2|nr:butyrate kinase [Jeotgalibaca sp. MA1X17-3]UJF16064.1 butyrate kinase [Jeotgalibaca sp. MA1X17-3]